jgi:hypothetical protein
MNQQEQHRYQQNQMNYVKALKQGGINSSGRIQADNSGQAFKPNMSYMQPQNYMLQSSMISDKFGEDSDTNCFLRAFSHLPCLPNSMSQAAKGVFGLVLTILSIAILAVVLGLMPVYLKDTPLFPSENFKQQETAAPQIVAPSVSFSIDVTNGLELRSPQLFDVLSSSDGSSIKAQNKSETFQRDMASLNEQLNNELKAKLDSNGNIDKIYNVRLNNRNDSRSRLDLSFTILSKPLLEEASLNLKDHIEQIIKSPDLSLSDVNLIIGNVTLTNQNGMKASLSAPVKGEILIDDLESSSNFSKMSEKKLKSSKDAKKNRLMSSKKMHNTKNLKASHKMHS